MNGLSIALCQSLYSYRLYKVRHHRYRVTACDSSQDVLAMGVSSGGQGSSRLDAVHDPGGQFGVSKLKYGMATTG